jgi:uncharacterized protein
MKDDRMASGDVPRPVHRGWPALVGAAAVFGAAAVALFVATALKLDFGATARGPIPLWSLLLPSAAGLLVLRVVPWRVPGGMERRTHKALRGRPLGLECTALLVCLAAFVILGLLSGPAWQPMDPGSWLVPGAKVLLLLLVPMIMFRILRPGWRRDAPRLLRLSTRVDEPWRWAGLVGVVPFIGLALLAEWVPAPPVLPGPAPAHLTFATFVLTLLTVAVLGEVFFRVWLQTRLEILYGRMPGILLASAVYALAQLVLRPLPGEFLASVASGLVVYGGVGIFLGYLWARYRNIWPVLLAHGILVLLPEMRVLAGG